MNQWNKLQDGCDSGALSPVVNVLGNFISLRVFNLPSNLNSRHQSLYNAADGKRKQCHKVNR